MKIGMVSLGCPKNLVDSEQMLALISAHEAVITNEPREAELIIVNTCGFINAAKEESINTILQMSAYKESAECRWLIVAGCLGQRYAKDLLDEIPEIDAVIGTETFTEIADVIGRVVRGERFSYLEKELTVPQPSVLPQQRILTTPGYTAYLKIAEGCDNYCSFCIIPKLRGRYKSRPFEEVAAEARNLAAGGVKELVVVAQDTTRYGEGSLRIFTLTGAAESFSGY